MVHCRDATASSFVATFQGESFAHFSAFAVKCHSSMWNGLFGLPGEFFVNKPLDVKENDEHALDFALQLSHLSRSQ
jgi:hypothetical protein